MNLFQKELFVVLFCCLFLVVLCFVVVFGFGFSCSCLFGVGVWGDGGINRFLPQNVSGWMRGGMHIFHIQFA